MTVLGQVYKTLPKGVRLLAYRNVTTSKINATYNQAQAESPLSYDINADSHTLGKVDGVSIYFEQLKAINPKAYEAFSAGQFNLSAQAQVNVNGFGFGYGITDRLTFYSILPYYTATVQMKYKQTKRSNLNQISDDIYSGGNGNGDISNTIGNITSNLPDTNGNLLQSVVVNTLGYKEVGTWSGSGYGDMELGTVYRLIDKGIWGAAVTSGAVLPTGRVDDPDILQDIGFGDGQFDFFAELDSGYSFSDKFYIGNTFRYTYQAPSQKTLRIPYNESFTLSDQKGTFNVKYGDKIDTVLNATYMFNDWFSMTPAYEFNYQMSSQYNSQYGKANEIMAMNSDRYAHVARLTTTISSIQPFLKKEFLLPASININLQETFAGKNVPKVGRFEVELRMLF